ncbi:hypothetical protein I317_07387 [Kwoniella heveanensis CBS 569]|nr:hypothetical protein I317_07387 [Kwoniella heveanensis CBS 569]
MTNSNCYVPRPSRSDLLNRAEDVKPSLKSAGTSSHYPVRPVEPRSAVAAGTSKAPMAITAALPSPPRRPQTIANSLLTIAPLSGSSGSMNAPLCTFFWPASQTPGRPVMKPSVPASSTTPAELGKPSSRAAKGATLYGENILPRLSEQTQEVNQYVTMNTSQRAITSENNGRRRDRLPTRPSPAYPNTGKTHTRKVTVKCETASNLDGMSLFKVTSVPGKNLGLVAVQRIKRGELILSESPFFLLPVAHPDEEITFDHVWPVYGNLTSDEQRKFRSLYTRKHEQVEHNELVNIVESNAVPIYKGGEEVNADFLGLGLFHTLNRINHSCAPNAGWKWYGEQMQMHLYAYTDIPAGIEICASYLSYQEMLYTYGPRSRRLREEHGFDCLCTACTKHPEEITASNENLRVCSDIWQRWGRSKICNYARDLNKAVQEIEEFVQLARVEHKWDFIGHAYAKLYEVYAVHGKAKEAKEAAQQAFEALSVTQGTGKSRAMGYGLLALDPTQYVRWGELNDDRLREGNRIQEKKRTRQEHLSAVTVSIAIKEEEGLSDTEAPTPSPPEEDVTQDCRRWKGDTRSSKKLRWYEDGPFVSPKSHKKKGET